MNEAVYELPSQSELYRRRIMRMYEEEWKRSLAPMPYHKEVLNSWRVAIRHVHGEYIINLGDNYIRNFSYGNLPDFLKVKLAYANNDEPLTSDEYLSYPDAFIYTGKNIALKHIGWRASESYYIVILTKQEMNSLKGETLNKETHDSREKSKEQSNEDFKRSGLLFFLPTNWRIW